MDRVDRVEIKDAQEEAGRGQGNQVPSAPESRPRGGQDSASEEEEEQPPGKNPVCSDRDQDVGSDHAQDPRSPEETKNSASSGVSAEGSFESTIESTKKDHSGVSRVGTRFMGSRSCRSRVQGCGLEPMFGTTKEQ